ncbi:MAG: class I SAM-dependent methyltransferase [Chloroflexi bacterium]|nr:class I SAM-dependent methyltransferase [Chloroflexota bacterium]
MPQEVDGKVIERYEQRAEEFIASGYRKEVWYLAKKLLSDWYMLYGLPLKDMRVLNVGCSEPIDEIFYASQVKEWVAVDLSPRSIETAQKILELEIAPDLCSKVRFQVEDMKKLTFPDESFDLVVSFSVVEHLSEQAERQQSLNEMARVCKKGGYVAVTVPNKLNVESYHWHLKATKEGRTDYGFAHFYMPYEIKKELINAGLKPVAFHSEIKNLSFPGFLWPVFKVLAYFGVRMGYLCRKE